MTHNDDEEFEEELDKMIENINVEKPKGNQVGNQQLTRIILNDLRFYYKSIFLEIGVSTNTTFLIY